MSTASAAYRPGDRVRVRQSYPQGHHRTPGYVKGKPGRISAVCGVFPNPESRAYGGDGLPEQPLYRVEFVQGDIWQGYSGLPTDTVYVDIYEHWLEAL